MFKPKPMILILASVMMLFCSSSVYSQIFLGLSGDNFFPNGFDAQIGIGPSESLIFSASNPSNVSVDTLDFDLFGFSLFPEFVSLVGVNGLGIFDGVSATNLSQTDPFSSTTGSLSIASSAVPEGNIFEVILDTTELPSTLQAFPEFVDPGNIFQVGFSVQASDFFNNGAVVPTSGFLDPIFNVAIPEPSSAVVLFACLLYTSPSPRD